MYVSVCMVCVCTRVCVCVCVCVCCVCTQYHLRKQYAKADITNNITNKPPKIKNMTVNTGKKNFSPTAMMYSWNKDDMKIGGRAASAL